jgi:putative colanic acid biosynthesis acetyltransferase WcaF
MSQSDIAANRRAIKWTRRELLGRIMWSAIYPLFRFSPRLLWGWRNLLLRIFGASIGDGVRVYPTVKIMIPWHLRIGSMVTIGDDVRLYALGSLEIGAGATVSQGAHLCAGTHDYTRNDFTLVKAPIIIGEDCWICADAFVGPHVSVGRGAVVGARAVAMRDVEPWTVVSGNPAQFVKRRELHKIDGSLAEQPQAADTSASQ